MFYLFYFGKRDVTGLGYIVNTINHYSMLMHICPFPFPVLGTFMSLAVVNKRVFTEYLYNIICVWCSAKTTKISIANSHHTYYNMVSELI